MTWTGLFLTEGSSIPWVKNSGSESEVDNITKLSKVPYERSQSVAELLKGLPVSEFIGLVKTIPLMKGAVETVKQLKNKNYKVGIISDSYTLATEILARKLEMDFQVANRLGVKNDVFTGHLKMPLGWEKIGCNCKQSVCKRYHLISLAKKYGIDMSNSVAVGDSSSDRCMLENAGIGILFNPIEGNIMKNVNCTVHTKDLSLILGCLKEHDS